MLCVARQSPLATARRNRPASAVSVPQRNYSERGSFGYRSRLSRSRPEAVAASPHRLYSRSQVGLFLVSLIIPAYANGSDCRSQFFHNNNNSRRAIKDLSTQFNLLHVRDNIYPSVHLPVGCSAHVSSFDGPIEAVQFVRLLPYASACTRLRSHWSLAILSTSASVGSPLTANSFVCAFVGRATRVISAAVALNDAVKKPPSPSRSGCRGTADLRQLSRVKT